MAQGMNGGSFDAGRGGGHGPMGHGGSMQMRGAPRGKGGGPMNNMRGGANRGRAGSFFNAAARRAEDSPSRTAGVATSTRRTTAIDVAAAGRSITAPTSVGIKASKAGKTITKEVGATI